MSLVTGVCRLPRSILWCVHKGNLSWVDRDLSPPQRPLSCCFDRKGFLSEVLGRGEKTAERGKCREGKREKGDLVPPFPASHRSKRALLKPNVQFNNLLPIGSICGAENRDEFRKDNQNGRT